MQPKGNFCAFVGRAILAIVLPCRIALAQQVISVGVKGGFPLTEFYADTNYETQLSRLLSPTRSFNSSRNYVVGPVVEFRLPFHLSLEADGLYRPLSAIYEYGELVPPNHIAANSDSWEIPILAKYRFNHWGVKPFVEAGPIFRVVEEPRNRFLSKDGGTAGAGVDLRLLHLHFEPEIRYTYWTADPSIAVAAHLGTHHNQAELLMGLLF